MNIVVYVLSVVGIFYLYFRIVWPLILEPLIYGFMYTWLLILNADPWYSSFAPKHWWWLIRWPWVMAWERLSGTERYCFSVQIGKWKYTTPFFISDVSKIEYDEEEDEQD
jgi:hypothetical protein